MAYYICDECGSEMDPLYEENQVICPCCGRWEQLTAEEMEDYERKYPGSRFILLGGGDDDDDF